jgi:hypothetical protein
MFDTLAEKHKGTVRAWVSPAIWHVWVDTPGPGTGCPSIFLGWPDRVLRFEGMFLARIIACRSHSGFDGLFLLQRCQAMRPATVCPDLPSANMQRRAK